MFGWGEFHFFLPFAYTEGKEQQRKTGTLEDVK